MHLFVLTLAIFASGFIFPRIYPRLQLLAEFNLLVVDQQGPDDVWQKTAGDINGDGRPDLIAGGNASGGLVWYENPTWSKHTIDPGGGFSTDAELVDVDGDGDNDLVSLKSDELRWYENPGWQAHRIDSRKLHDVEVADFDGDGDIDLVARGQSEFGHEGNALHFYQQSSSTQWQYRMIRCANGEGLKVEDIDRDGDPDAVINGSWFENTGDILNGPWTEHSYTSSWSHPNTYVATGDINGDGRVDIVLAPAELAGQTYRISWFEAPQDARDNNWTEHTVEDGVEAVHHFVGSGDFDNDGDMDIAAAEMEQGEDPDEIKIYVNEDGSGGTWSKHVMATTGSHSMRILDYDIDGDLDLYGANWEGNRIELYVNQFCPPNLDSWDRHTVDLSRPWRAVFIISADMDGDGQMDIITGGWWYQNPGVPGGNWTRYEIGLPLRNMAVVYDFDADGRMDILGTMGQGSVADPRFVWARNNGSGSFSILSNIETGAGDFLQGVAVGHLADGEGLKVAISWHSPGSGVQMLSVPEDPISGTWTIETISPVSQDEALSMGDIDRDGDRDLLLGTIWLENQDGSWIQHTLHDTSGLPYGEIDPDRNRLADINGDGRMDAVVGFEAISVPGKLAWYEQGVDATTAWQEHIIETVVGPMSLDVVDIDHDGDYDVIVGEHNLGNPSGANLYVLENSDGRGGQWESHLVYTGDEHHDGAQAADVDIDGDLDILSIGWGHDDVLLYENIGSNCPVIPSPSPTSSPSLSPTSSPSPSPTPSPSPSPTSSPSPSPTPSPPPKPTLYPVPILTLYPVK